MTPHTPIRNPEEAIDKTLAALRQIEPAEGMNRRILANLEAKAATQPQPWRRFLLFPQLAIPAAAALLAAIALLAHNRNAPTPAQVARTTTASSVQPCPEKGCPTSGFSDVGPHRAQAATTPAPLTGHRALRTRTTATTPQPLTADEALALAELHAPSLPAPPLPLTDEEKRLLHVVTIAGPEPLLMLNAKVREQQIAASKSEFQHFFAQPTVKFDEQN